MKFIATLIGTVLAIPAMACSSLKQPTEAELFSGASSVFRARVTEVKLAKFANPSNAADIVEIVEARYELKELFKGTPPASGVVRDLPFGPGNCSLGLLPGLEYVFFPDKNDMVLLLSGSFGYLNADGTDVKPHLDAIRNLASGK